MPTHRYGMKLKPGREYCGSHVKLTVEQKKLEGKLAERFFRGNRSEVMRTALVLLGGHLGYKTKALEHVLKYARFRPLLMDLVKSEVKRDSVTSSEL